MSRRPTYSVRIVSLMREAGWTDAHLAAAAAVSARTIADIRNGRSASLRPASARVIAAALSSKLGREVTPEYVAGDRGAER